MEIEINDNNWENLVNGDKPVLIDFWATWCGPCRHIAPFVEKMAEEFDGKVVVGKVNVDNQDCINITSQFGIRNIPTLLFFKGGEIVDKHVGALTENDLREKVNKLL
ncbi:MAG: thioredoxin [Bacteroidales bacterium]|jgi:thioredoxin 1|nr:thioredoxin [Bacteroidales bacterium]MBO7345990.1 thioredoxin [Bacteroidales bacterium]MBQ4477074.1 thioredoxin [Bacteroidales bacterium]MBR4452982.1 thioredoxin [Bacteroidales bacterium]MCR5555229.1 thioredoxin [Bacteroidales bacterium]